MRSLFLLSLTHNLLDQLWIFRQQTCFGQARRQVKPVAIHGKNFLEQRQVVVHTAHVRQGDSVPLDHLGAVRDKLLGCAVLAKRAGIVMQFNCFVAGIHVVIGAL